MSKHLLAILGVLAALARGGGEERVRFNRDIRPILSENCFSCHGADSAGRKAGLRLDERDAALKKQAFVPGKPHDSELVRRILSDDPQEVMPPPKLKKTLTASQKELLRRWIVEGAEYERHWAFQSIAKQIPVPTPADKSSWIRNPIDAFVLERLQREKLEPAPAAPRETWLRRVNFDLTGLPPTLDEIDAFLADTSPRAFENVVERLFKSPAYGERMANDWLDVARFADTFGYQADRLMHVWPWRDWVIAAFQKNLPYDRFILWQTAGDLLPNATSEQKLATAFNRLNRQTNEGGSIPEEFRIEYVADRLRTNGMAFLGLSLECARCHDHKYDPVSTKDYYQLSSFFNNIDEHGVYSHFTETAPTPNLLTYTGSEQEKRHQELLRRIDAKLKELSAYAARAGASKREVEQPRPIAKFSFEDVEAKGDYRIVPGKTGRGIQFGGDDAFRCGPEVAAFGRTDPFTLALWLKPEQHRPRMVVLHRSRAAEDSAFRGYSLVLDDGRPVVSLVHFWPGNAIQIRAKDVIPLNAWSHVAFTYDGSSRAAGLRLYVDGRAVATEIVRDRLDRDITHRSEWNDMDVKNVQLSLGARFRDVGFQKGCIDELQVFDRDLSPLEIAAVGGFEVPVDDANRRHHTMRSEAEYQQIRKELRALCAEENELVGKIPQIMVMKELTVRRATHVLSRGAYDAPRERVEADTPAEILPFAADYPRNRLGFAKWLLDDRHPLTSRVAVNRLWQLFFQRGLVATTEDFGTQGALPSHPELLDWLARHFMDSGWDVQDLCRTIVLSATYRQASLPRNVKELTLDPDNRMLGRGPRGRLSAEMIRDQSLALSGLLVRKVGGPSVYPYQPAGVWEESGTNQAYRTSKGADLYRRSLYTFWRRTSPPPSMVTFDAPSREFCIARRESTSTPLQALVLLNDPQYIEAARVWAERLLVEPDTRTRITKAFRMATSRQPTPAEIAILQRMYDEQRDRFERTPEAAKEYLKIGESARNVNLPASAHAALTVVLQSLLNLDECVTKR